MGGRAFGPPQAQALAPHFLETDFLKKIFCKKMNSVSHPVGTRVSKHVVLTCAEIYPCKISEVVLKLMNPWSFDLWLESNHLNIMCKSSNPLDSVKYLIEQPDVYETKKIIFIRSEKIKMLKEKYEKRKKKHRMILKWIIKI